MLKSETKKAYAEDIFKLQKYHYGNYELPEKDIRLLLTIIDESCDFKIEAYASADGLTARQRLATCLISLVYLPIMPLQWLLTGRTGIRGKNKYTIFLLRLCGKYN